MKAQGQNRHRFGWEDRDFCGARHKNSVKGERDSWWTRLTAALLLLMVDRCRLRECNDDRGRCNNIEIEIVPPGGGGGCGYVSGSWPAE